MTVRPAAALAPLLALLAGAAGLLANPGLAPGQPRLVRPAESAPASSAAGSAQAASSARPAPPAPTGFAPDPPPLVTRRKWVYQIIWHEGAVFVPTPRLIERPRPSETPRAMGRFAIELYVGRTLVDRVRFELPNLDGDVFSGQKRPRNAGPDMERRVRVKAAIEVPDSDRATYAVLVDRATGLRQRLPWVPVDLPPASAASAPSARVPAPSPMPASASSAAPAASSSAGR